MSMAIKLKEVREVEEALVKEKVVSIQKEFGEKQIIALLAMKAQRIQRGKLKSTMRMGRFIMKTHLTIKITK